MICVLNTTLGPKHMNLDVFQSFNSLTYLGMNLPTVRCLSNVNALTRLLLRSKLEARVSGKGNSIKHELDYRYLAGIEPTTS